MARNTKRHKTRAIFLCEDNLKIENGNGPLATGRSITKGNI